ncbi:MAG: hypothetical protein U9R52_02485, partial [Candidatus Omnitrophota bacterium]|nr:hypothetical protein [Candidatus Omnitrophota bacterium]
MKNKQYIISFMCLFVFCAMPVFAEEERFQRKVLPPGLPQEVLKKIPSNEHLPEEFQAEFKDAPEFHEVEITSEAPDLDQQAGQEIADVPVTDKISLDFKGVDIIDVLKMLSARSNLNIVAGKNVKGKVTLFLKDVDIWDAFEIILTANKLAYDKEKDIINVMTERDYEQLYGEKYYNKKELRLYKLKYAKAANISKALNQVKSKIGKVVIDESS